MVSELPKRLFTGKEVAQVTGWTEGDMFTWMLHARIMKCDAERLADQRANLLTEIVYDASHIASQHQNETVKSDLSICSKGIFCSWWSNTAAFDNEREDHIRAATRVSLWLFGDAETGSEFILPNLASALFTAHEIAAACAWDETVIADLWAISGEARPVVTPGPDGQQDETPEMCVDRMRREGAGNIEILRRLRQMRGRDNKACGNKACGTLLFPDINPEAAKSKVRRMRQEHEID